MASKLNHGDGASKPIHYMRIILPETLSQGKLRIPEKFVRKYGKRLSNPMFLELPNGAKWEVNVEKRENGVWFHKGWKEFMEYYSLAHGHLLVFKYDGTSHFHVFICGQSAMEIDYTLNKEDRKRANKTELHPGKIRRANKNRKDKSNSNVKDCRGKGKLKNQSEKKKNIDKHSKRSSISNCGEAAGKISFRVTMKSSYLKWYLNLPKGSVRGNVKPGAQDVTLQVGDKSWRVNMIHYQISSATCFSAGWSIFARENNLEEGDSCLFELLNNSDDIVMNVSISKRSFVK